MLGHLGNISFFYSYKTTKLILLFSRIFFFLIRRLPLKTPSQPLRLLIFGIILAFKLFLFLIHVIF